MHNPQCGLMAEGLGLELCSRFSYSDFFLWLCKSELGFLLGRRTITILAHINIEIVILFLKMEITFLKIIYTHHGKFRETSKTGRE